MGASRRLFICEDYDAAATFAGRIGRIDMGFLKSLFGRELEKEFSRPDSKQIRKVIPARESSESCGQYEGVRDRERLLTIMRESAQLALKSKNAETAHSRFDLSIEAYYQVRSLLGPSEQRTRLDEYMESVANDSPAHSILNEMGGYVAKAKKVKTTKTQVKYLNLAREVLAKGLRDRILGFERLAPSHQAVVTELQRIQGLTADVEKTDQPLRSQIEEHYASVPQVDSAESIETGIGRSAIDGYFDLLGQFGRSISDRDYNRAAQLARNSIELIPGMVSDWRKEMGGPPPPSIPVLEKGGTMLALEGDSVGLAEMERLVTQIPDLANRLPTILSHQEDLALFAKIESAVKEEPGLVQKDLKSVLDEMDGHRIARLVGWLEKANRIERRKHGKTYRLYMAGGSPDQAPDHPREVSSHRAGEVPLSIRIISLDSLPYAPLPRSPAAWEERNKGIVITDPVLDWFEVNDSGTWHISKVDKLPLAERPDTAFRRLYPLDSGLLLLDDLGKSNQFGQADSSAILLNRDGEYKVGGALLHDCYRFDANPMGNGFIGLSKAGIVHAYDSELTSIMESNLWASPEVEALRKRFGIQEDELRTHLRCVAISKDNDRYLATGVDEAWCLGLSGEGVWGVRLPYQEGWKQVTQPSEGHGTSQDVVDALGLMNLAFPYSADDIKTRFRELAMNWHPDRVSSPSASTQKMKQLNSAYELLTGLNPAHLDSSAAASFTKSVGSETIDADGIEIEMSWGLSGGERQAADWIYAAAFGSQSRDVFLAGYSGRVVKIDHSGRAVSAFDLGAVPRTIVDTGDYLYLLTDTRLYVMRDEKLVALIDTYHSGGLIVAQTGFGLMETNLFRWFSEDGSYLGGVRTKNPIRRVYSQSDQMIVETRQRRAVIESVGSWWESSHLA